MATETFQKTIELLSLIIMLLNQVAKTQTVLHNIYSVHHSYSKFQYHLQQKQFHSQRSLLLLLYPTTVAVHHPKLKKNQVLLKTKKSLLINITTIFINKKIIIHLLSKRVRIKIVRLHYEGFFILHKRKKWVAKLITLKGFKIHT